MKNRLDHESLIDATYSYCNNYACVPNRCKLSIPLVLLAFTAAFNLWWFLLQYGRDSQLLNLEAPAPATFCNSRSIASESCDIFKGKWVPDPNPPLYTNDTCPYIFPNQDCMTNGRPDRDFIHWKWQPHDCEIPAFNSTLFLQLMTGKKMLFVGDSLARNQMQSLLCSLSQVEKPENVWSKDEGLESKWGFASYNFTVALAWSPFLVSYTVHEGTWKLHVDRPDERWASQLDNYEIAVFSTMYWFFRRSIYYVQGKIISQYDPANATSPEEVFILKHVWSTTLSYLVENYTGIAIVRTPSVSHFEGNPWDKGGICHKTQPEFDPHMNMSLPWVHNEIRNIQKTQLSKALNLVRATNSSCHLKLLDVTYNTLLRPDGHPSGYRIQNPTEPRNDCTHWCMPGPIDSWNQLLFADPQIMCA